MVVKSVKLSQLSKGARSAIINRASAPDSLLPSVSKIIEDVKSRGDEALRQYTEKFDGAKISEIRVQKNEIVKARPRVSKEALSAMKHAISNLEEFHKKQLPFGERLARKDGSILGRKIVPIDSVGVYVPGGRASYPSSLIMACVPAKIAGVRRIAVCTPPKKDGSLDDAVLAAAGLLGIDEIYKVGGVQAIAALAYGTKSIQRVEKIVGPGSAYVTAAKKLVFGTVSIDMLAGPSEVLIIADDSAEPYFAAADMLAQAEHDPSAISVLVTTSGQFAKDVSSKLSVMLSCASRKDVAGASLEKNGLIIIADKIADAIEFANDYAPEHLVIMTRDDDFVLDAIRNAGSVFMGGHSPVTFGDYCAGTNHVLPTGGSARASSGLSVDSFIKKITYQKISKRGFDALSDTAVRLASLEGLHAHAHAVTVRSRSEGRASRRANRAAKTKAKRGK